MVETKSTRRVSETTTGWITDSPASPLRSGDKRHAEIERKPHKQQRIVESGCLTRPIPQKFAVLSEARLSWLFSLDKTNTSKLIIVGAKSPAEFRAALETKGLAVGFVNRAVTSIGLSRLVFQSEFTPSTDALLLVSGSVAFCHSTHLRFPGQRIVSVVDEHWTGRGSRGRLPAGPTWHVFRHSQFGGATTYRTLIGVSGLALNPNETKLERNLGHIFDFGLRPEGQSLPPDPTTPTDDLTLDQLLPIHNLKAGIIHPTHFCSSGWGRWPLTLEELGIAFGLPVVQRSGLEWDMFPFPPMQVLDAVLHPLVPQGPVASEFQTPTPRVLQPPAALTYLPRLQKNMDHKWADPAFVTAAATKGDSAAVHNAIWDLRIASPLPHLARLVSFFRTQLMIRIRRRLWLEFRGYMRSTHGDNWSLLLQSQRRTTLVGKATSPWRLARQALQHLPCIKLNYGEIAANAISPGAASRRKRGEVASVMTPGGSQSPNVDTSLPRVSNKPSTLSRDAETGLDVLDKINHSDWWTWHSGSTLFFWRWNGDQQRVARDGMRPWVSESLPKYRRAAKAPKKADLMLLLPKLQSILARRYVWVPPHAFTIRSLIDYFAVPKGFFDIRLVYNGTSCGMNTCLWAPNFWLPTPNSALRVLDFNFFSVDADLGEMFLNFPLDETLQLYSGIDWTHMKELLIPDPKLRASFPDRFWVVWGCCWMGSRPSPHFAVRFYCWAEEFARGLHTDKNNALRWDCIPLNLPGDPKWDPIFPRVMKWNKLTDSIAGDIIAFIDDLRASGCTLEQAWQVTRQAVSRLQCLGMQDAPRKRRPSSQTPGAWAGGVFATTNGRTVKSVTQAKWDKARKHVFELLEKLEANPQASLEFKHLEVVRGFLCHLAMTCDISFPCLKGFHLTLASHSPQRDRNGWKMTDKAWAEKLVEEAEEQAVQDWEEKLNDFEEDSEWVAYQHSRREKATQRDKGAPTTDDSRPKKPPSKIKPVPHLVQSVKALSTLFAELSPPEFDVRANRVHTSLFGFHDASGKGLGSTVMGKDGVRHRIGAWDSDTEDESSNFREFENGVLTMEDEAAQGRLDGAFVFICTDNFTVECALDKGNSSSTKLFSLVLRLRALEMKHGARITFSHVSGERMKAQGTDGVSRGHLKEGTCAGEAMLDFIPFNESAVDRSPKLKSWVTRLWGHTSEFLTPDEWFTRGHDHKGGSSDKRKFWRPKFAPGTFIWSPPPAAASVALEELRKARIKRQDSTHVIITPRLMSPEWRRQLHKASDVVFEIPPGSVLAWPKEMREPLMLGVCFPFLRCFPWQLRSTPKMFCLGREMRRVLKESDLATGDFLRKFLLDIGRLPTLPQDVVRRMLFFERRGPVSCPNRSKRSRKRPRGRPTADETLGKKAKTSG